MKRTTVAVILCALLAVAGACGSSKKDTTATEGAASAEKPSETTVSTAGADTTLAPTTTTTAAAAASTSTTAAAGAPASGSPEGDFAAQGNALCSKFNDQVSAVPQPTATTPAALGAYLDQALTLLDQQIGEMKSLTPPPSLTQAWAQVVQAIDAEQAQIKALVPRLQAGDASAITEMQGISSDDINSQFDALGMTTCGSGSGG